MRTARATRLMTAVFLVLGLVLAGYAPSAFATNPLLPGGVVSPVPLDNSILGAPILADTGPLSFTALDFTGTLESIVVTDPNTGHLDFVYQVVQTGGNHSIDRVTVGPYDATTTAVAYTTIVQGPSVGTVAPASADRDPSGDVVGFNFTSGLLVGTASYWFWVQTNSDVWGPGTASVIDLGIASVESYAPVPVPPAALLLGSGLMGLAGVGWRRKRRAG